MKPDSSTRSSSVSTLVLPVAGLGKRLYPLTENCPKALVRVNGRPLLEYVLYEASQSGIAHVVLVISPQHETHFREYLSHAETLFPALRFSVRVQQEPLGDGHALLQADDLIGENPVAVRFCDDLCLDKESVLGSLIRLYSARAGSVLLVERVSKNIISRYGVIGTDPTFVDLSRNGGSGGVHKVLSFVEKPLPEEAPSDLGVIGGYVLAPSVLQKLRALSARIVPGHHDALRIADGLKAELSAHGDVYALEFTGSRLDCGTVEGFQAAENHLRTHTNHFFANTVA